MDFRKSITDIIGTKPSHLPYYKTAFTHVSALDDISITDKSTESYERLEFEGDSVLYLVVTHYIYTIFPEEDEGFMTRLRAKLVCGSTCALFSKYLNLEQFIIKSKKTKTFKHHSDLDIIEDVFESLIGAIYLDLGLKACENFILKLLTNKDLIDFKKLTTVDNNYKDILMRFTHAYNYELPIYTIEEQYKKDSVNMITMSVSLKNKATGIVLEYGRGTASIKQEAEQKACEDSICKNLEKDVLHKLNCKKIHMHEIKDIIDRTNVKNKTTQNTKP